MNEAGEVTEPGMKRARKGAEMNRISTLPEDMLAEIFLRLPVNDLNQRLKLVCRSWYELITGPRFAGFHRRYWIARIGLVFTRNLWHWPVTLRLWGPSLTSYAVSFFVTGASSPATLHLIGSITIFSTRLIHITC